MTQTQQPDYIGAFELYVDAERFDKTEVLKVGDKTFVKKEKILEMLKQWDEKLKKEYIQEQREKDEEIARLRKALDRIAKGRWDNNSESLDDTHMANIATEALKQV